jgi:hypothetical protein
MNPASLIQFVLLFLTVVILHIVWAKHRIKQWAERNDYVITRCRICLTDIGPFSYFGTSGGQSVFKIEALNTEGEAKKGYARAGGFFFGLLRKRVEVKWDKIP